MSTKIDYAKVMEELEDAYAEYEEKSTLLDYFSVGIMFVSVGASLGMIWLGFFL